MATFSISFTSAWVLSSTFLLMRLPVLGRIRQCTGLPAAVASLAYAALPVGTFFSHVVHLFSRAAWQARCSSSSSKEYGGSSSCESQSQLESGHEGCQGGFLPQFDAQIQQLQQYRSALPCITTGPLLLRTLCH